MQQKSKFFVRQNRPPQDEPWLWLTREMLESEAWRGLSNAARHVIYRIAIEHMHHGGQENGRLPVTYADFVAYGVPKNMVAGAIREATELGFIAVTERGAGGNREFRRPSLYALAWLPMDDGTATRHRWKKFGSLADARRAASKARDGAPADSSEGQLEIPNASPLKGGESAPLFGSTRMAG